MITITGFLQRAEFRDLFSRWLAGEPRPVDAVRIKELVNFNSIAVRLARARMAYELLPIVYHRLPQAMPVRTKGEVKDLLARSPELRSAPDPHRIRQCLDRYAGHPELFYRGTPVEGVAYLDPVSGHLLATGRIKRIRRIADKCSRRVMAAVSGIAPLDGTTASDDLETRVVARIRELSLAGPEAAAPVHDVLGFKLLGADAALQRTLEWIDAQDAVTLVRRKDHHGDFRATSLVVAWTPPWGEIATAAPHPPALDVLRARGMEGDLRARFRGFVDESEKTIHAEIIVQDYPDAMESEIGRSMHEDRIIRQRRGEPPFPAVAETIGALTRFIFYFALSRRVDLPGIPIRLTERYMPDRLEQAFLELTDFPAGDLGLVP